MASPLPWWATATSNSRGRAIPPTTTALPLNKDDGLNQASPPQSSIATLVATASPVDHGPPDLLLLHTCMVFFGRAGQANLFRDQTGTRGCRMSTDTGGSTLKPSMSVEARTRSLPVAPRESPPPPAEAVTASHPLVGTVVRFRRIVRSDIGIVLGIRERGHAEIVTARGKVSLVPLARVKDTRSIPHPEVRSTIGRLRHVLDEQDNPPPSEAQAAVVRARINDLMTKREQAIPLLLDRRHLSLSTADCLALPIEPWRVRYELLRDGPREGTDGLADSLIADPEAPLAIRALVALKHSRHLSEVGPEAELLFAGDAQVVNLNELTTSAVRMAEAFATLSIPGHRGLALAATTPEALADSHQSALVLATLSGKPLDGRALEVDRATPTSLVDDLIDAGVPVSVVADESGHPLDPALHRYVVARTDPERLLSTDVVSLRFEYEAQRRYLTGDTTVAPALPAETAASLIAYRMAILGGDRTATIDHPTLRELRDVILSHGQIPPSEPLLSDRSVWRELIDAGVPGDSQTGPLGEEYVGVSALSRASSCLYEWRMDEARTIAREGLRRARREDIRDELLNVVACSLWLSGEPEPALAALDNALDGAYTDSLLINASVVAAELEHDSAIARFVKLASEAPSAQQRAIAAERALVLWDNDAARLWGNDANGALPKEIRHALRPLIKETLPEERYLRVIRVLANRDEHWLAKQEDAAFGSNVDSPAARIFRARATGVQEYVKALGSELQGDSTPEWVPRERDSVVEAAINALFQNVDHLPAAMFGLLLIDGGLPMPARQRVSLKCLTVISVVANVPEGSGEPQFRFIDLIDEAIQELPSLDGLEQAGLRAFVTTAAESLTRSYLAARSRQLNEATIASELIINMSRAIPRQNLNRAALREHLKFAREFCKDTISLFDRLQPMINDAQLKEAIASTRQKIHKLRQDIGMATL